MAGYQGGAAYDLSLFEPLVVDKPQVKKASSQKKKSTSPKTEVNTNKKAHAKAQTVNLGALAVKTVAVAIFFCLCLVGLLAMDSQSNELDKQIAAVQSQIDIAEGESVRLNAELSNKISTEKIEDYAENVLGMVKAESYQINYIDLTEGDEIVVSGDKTVENKPDVSGKIKSLFAYIF